MKITQETLSKQIKTEVPPNFGDRIVQRIKSADFTQSKSTDNDMLVLETEIIKPATWVSPITGDTYQIDSLGLTYYVVFTEKNQANVAGFLAKMGFDPYVDTDHLKELNPETGVAYHISWAKQFVGVCFASMTRSYEEFDKKLVGPGKWEILKDESGKNASRGWAFSTNLGDLRARVQPPQEAESKPF